MARSDKNQDDPRLKDPDLYETLRDKGNSKEKAARISNAQANQGMHPSKKGGSQAAYEDWSKKELYGRAREIGIDGRSKMTKAELIDALRHH
ncbi:MAG TPA: Rho termination factor [Aurantimonas sp.]